MGRGQLANPNGLTAAPDRMSVLRELQARRADARA